MYYVLCLPVFTMFTVYTRVNSEFESYIYPHMDCRTNILIVRAAFKIEAARNAGIIIDKITEDPLSTYMNSRPATKDAGTMVAIKKEYARVSLKT